VLWACTCHGDIDNQNNSTTKLRQNKRGHSFCVSGQSIKDLLLSWFLRPISGCSSRSGGEVATLTKVGVAEAYIGMDPEMRSPEGSVSDSYRAVVLTRQGGPEVLEVL
jgi:hypothetical protein